MSKKMNLVMVTIDSLRKDHVGAYGNEWIKTPNLDKFINGAAKFTRAYPESMPTLPFRRSLLTGKRVFPYKNFNDQPAYYPFEFKFNAPGLIPGWKAIPAEDKPLSELLLAKGYNTSLVTDCFHQHFPGMNYHRGYKCWQFIRGQEYDLWRTSANLEDKQTPAAEPYLTDVMKEEGRKTWELTRHLTNNANRSCEEDYSPARVFRGAVEWMERNNKSAGDEGFFLNIDCFDPHEPWDAPQHYRDMYDKDYKGTEVLMPLYSDKCHDYLSDDELKHMRALYAAELTMVDTWFGYFMERLELLGMDKNTIVVVVSDHGHQLGEKGFTGKCPWGMMPALMDIVLAIRHPEGVGAGKTFETLCMNHDIAPTVFDMMGIEHPSYFEGKSLFPVMKGETDEVREFNTSCFKDYFLIRNNDWALQCKSDETEVELYDLSNDPDFLTNVAADHPEVCKDLIAKLREEAGGKIPVYAAGDKLLERNKD